MRHQVPERENQITEGVIWKQLLLFFFPILFGTFFQQLYNAADAMIVGRFVGKEALSAVAGSTGMLTQMVVGFFVGLSSGAAVLVSQYYGAKRADMVNYAVHTFVAFSILAGLVMTFLGIALAPWMLKAMETPAEVMEMSVLYLRVYFAGLIGNLAYNSGAAILRAVGDSRRPLYFLISSCLINIVLDVFLVVILGLGVLGAALATVLCQAMSAGMVIFALMRTKDMYHLDWRQMRMDPRMLKRTIRIGFPSGLQSVMYGISNVIIQAAINSLGTDSVAAWAAYSKIDSLFWMVVSSFGIAVTTFVGQNFGAGKMDRAKRGMVCGIAVSFGFGLLLSYLSFFHGALLTGIFAKDSQIVLAGADYLRAYAIDTLLVSFLFCFTGYFNGCGRTAFVMIQGIMGAFCVRIPMSYFMSRQPGASLFQVGLAIPMSTVVQILVCVIYFARSQRQSAPTP